MINHTRTLLQNLAAEQVADYECDVVDPAFSPQVLTGNLKAVQDILYPVMLSIPDRIRMTELYCRLAGSPLDCGF